MIRLLAVLCILTGRAVAQDGCDDLWFTRNLVFDRAGYCFSSALGKAIFDNAGCTGRTVVLGTVDKALVARVRDLETQYGCHVDTGRTGMALADAAFRRLLTDLPIRDEFESGCLGWRAAGVPLLAGQRPGAKVIGRIEPGDFVAFAHLPEAEWTYVTTHGPGWTDLRSGGWLGPGLANATSCDAWAG